MTIYGNDISRHQTLNAVNELHAGGKSSFIITRSNIGTSKADEKFKTFISDIQRLNIKNSHYMANYCKNVEEAIAEADCMCDLIESVNDKVEMPLFFDWEYFSADYIKKYFGITITPSLLQSMALAFCRRIQERGYKAGIYLNKDYWDRFYGDAFFKNHPEIYVWYARPGYSKPDKPCYLWQYSSDNGRDFGYTGGNIDKNILMGNYIEEVKPMKPLSKEPCRMYIGFASQGDIKKLISKINGLGIDTEVNDGYITTGHASAGDQCYIMLDCNALGIPCKIYEEPKECENCQKLKAENEFLKQENIEIKENLKSKDTVIEKLTDKLENIKTIIGM